MKGSFERLWLFFVLLLALGLGNLARTPAPVEAAPNNMRVLELDYTTTPKAGEYPRYSGTLWNHVTPVPTATTVPTATPQPTATPGAAPTEITGTGLVVRTGANTFTTHSIQDDGFHISVSNGSGVSGDPTINLRSDFVGGWIHDATLTRSSSTVLNRSNADATYSKGDKVRLFDSTAVAYKYSYVVAVSSTQITVVGDGVPSNLDTSLCDFSKAETPVGFPQRFSFTTTPTGFSANPTIVMFYSIKGQTCFVSWQTTATGTSNSTGFTISIPVTAAGTGYWWVGNAFQGSSGGVYADRVDGNITGGSNTISFSRNGGQNNFVNDGLAKGASGQMWYDF